MSYVPPTPTEKQLDILWRMSKGYSNRMIADSMGIAVYTVKSHLLSLYRKMGFTPGRARSPWRSGTVGSSERGFDPGWTARPAPFAAGDLDAGTHPLHPCRDYYPSPRSGPDSG